MILILIGFLIHGCKSYVQVLGTSAPKVKVEDGLYVLENDSLKITYNFWTQRGLMSFAIYNKLDKPLYIDWKKSSYINNSVKLDYWVEEEQEKSSEYYGSYYYDGPLLRPGYAVSNIGGVSASSTKRVERIAIIPPASNYYHTQFYILPKSFFKLDTQADFKDVPRHDKPKKNTKVYDQSYLKENSPLVFRNFLTFSFSEDFNKEFYFDNEFYVT